VIELSKVFLKTALAGEPL